ncbi:endo-1,4-beta-xylanase [Leeuwenhoekiella sp. W20_SRS_FM14]|uniref:endo-1,4-beta-xylanase n=1 Tax=Leeuwenhoekiella sp. W20_SRS_FM14 TaxID=3240270 RepID=UPI003F98E220
MYRIQNSIFKNIVLVGLISFAFLSCKTNNSKEQDEVVAEKMLSLKDAFKGKFLIGTALNLNQIEGRATSDIALIKEQFNSIVAENCMKSENLFTAQGTYDFTAADAFVKFGEDNNMVVHGHTLIWHSQLPEWFFKDSLGNQIDKVALTERMKSHISTVVGRYKGRVKSWDVVNEAVLDNGELRKSKFYEILGDSYLKLAFEFAHEADPEAELYYNDYNTSYPEKRAGIIKMLSKLQSEGVQLDGMGMQGHVGVDKPTVAEFEKSITAFADLGLKVAVTEFDITVLPFPKNLDGAEVSNNAEYKEEMNPYINGIPDSLNVKFTNRYLDFFKVFLKHQDKMEKITFWGVNDGNSWRNDWPIAGRTDYPLLFDRENKAKPVVDSIIKLALKN